MIASSFALLIDWHPLKFDPGTLFWTWAVFGVVVFVISKFAWKPLIAALEAREKKIEDGILKAERAEAEAKRAAAETEAKLREAFVKADQIVEETRARGEKLAKELESEARSAADKVLQRAREEITLAKQQAVEEMRVLAVDLALEAASSVVGRAMNQDDHRRLAGAAIDQMKRG
ncbi:MAG: ATP synthase F0 subunit B [Planctomycetes bacterium]|nr:ATP synthase F0 subunit B [Planctomycetota bacterium]